MWIIQSASALPSKLQLRHRQMSTAKASMSVALALMAATALHRHKLWANWIGCRPEAAAVAARDEYDAPLVYSMCGEAAAVVESEQHDDRLICSVGDDYETSRYDSRLHHLADSMADSLASDVFLSHSLNIHNASSCLFGASPVGFGASILHNQKVSEADSKRSVLTWYPRQQSTA